MRVDWCVCVVVVSYQEYSLTLTHTLLTHTPSPAPCLSMSCESCVREALVVKFLLLQPRVAISFGSAAEIVDWAHWQLGIR